MSRWVIIALVVYAHALGAPKSLRELVLNKLLVWAKEGALVPECPEITKAFNQLYTLEENDPFEYLLLAHQLSCTQEKQAAITYIAQELLTKSKRTVDGSSRDLDRPLQALAYVQFMNEMNTTLPQDLVAEIWKARNTLNDVTK